MTATAGCSSVGFCSVRISPIGGCIGCPKLMRRGALVMSGGSGDGSLFSNLGFGCGERPSGVWKVSSSEEDPCKSTYGRCVNSAVIIYYKALITHTNCLRLLKVGHCYYENPKKRCRSFFEARQAITIVWNEGQKVVWKYNHLAIDNFNSMKL